MVNETEQTRDDAAGRVEIPRTPGEIARHLGPGLIITASIVGSGELIVTTKLGGDVGFRLLWFIILGCLVKVFIQVELGRYALTQGKTTLEALDSVPGPRLKVSWLVWVWAIMFLATFFQLSGIVGGIAGVFRTGGSTLANWVWALIITGSCAALLTVGRYRLIERFSAGMVAFFTLFTIFAVGALHWTDFNITGAQLIEGFAFKMPDKFTTAFAAFGIIGVGASELIYYPYWCLEKGYATYVGPRDNSLEWEARAKAWLRVMRIDAFVSLVIYTGATIAFYLLGAAVLHGKGLSVDNDQMIPVLSTIYSESFGAWGLWVFLIGAFVVLYSTVFISTATNARLFADFGHILGLIKMDSPESKAKVVRYSCLLLPAVYFVFFVSVGQPLYLVFAGALAQGIMLPLLAGAALYFHYSQTPKALKPGAIWVTLLWIASILMASVGVYQIIDKIRTAVAGG